MPSIFNFPKKTKTEKEYLKIFEKLMEEVESTSYKAELFKKLVDKLDIALLVLRGENSLGDCCQMIEDKIGRSLTKDEKAKIEVLRNASKSVFITTSRRKDGTYLFGSSRVKKVQVKKKVQAPRRRDD